MILCCQRCGSGFKTGNRRQKYCSRKCYELARTIRVSITCLHCGEEFDVAPHDVNKRKYCSRRCKCEAQRKLTKYKCQQCGEAFFLNWANSPRKYCSPECSAQANDTRTVAICECCGEEFLVRECIANDESRGIYCSNECRYRMNRNRESCGWKAGYREDLGNIYFRSSWEANYARLLNHLKGSYLIRSWEFESDIFDLPSGRYLPDFRVESIDGSIAYHEVKGYMTDVAREKLQDMSTERPDVKVVLIGPETYAALESTYAGSIVNWEGPNG